MSTTLTWNFSGLATKSGTTNTALIDDIVALVNSKSGDANYKWQVASSNTAGNPLYVVLKRKDASAGRLLLMVFSSAPGASNTAAFDQNAQANQLYGAWFPNGNVDTPSNIAVASGTMMGNDTGAVKSWAGISVVSAYGTGLQLFTVDNNEAIYIFFQNPGSASLFGAGAGKVIVDGADVEYEAVVSFGTTSLGGLGSTGVMPWTGTVTAAGTTTPCVRTNYGSANRTYFSAWTPNGAWASTAVGSTDVMSDTAQQKSWFQSVSLIGQVKGEGIILKLRQIGMGPSTTAAFTPYNTTGPVVAARQCNAQTTGGIGYPWFTNFKI